MTEYKVYATVAEVAAVLRVSKMTIYRMVKVGDLEAKRVGRSFRIVVASLLEKYPEMAEHELLAA